MQLHVIDLTIIGLYLCLLIFIGFIMKIGRAHV